MQNGYQKYARTDIQTSDPRAIVVLLYEGAIKFLTQASACVEKNERNEMSEYLLKTQKIIQFLTTALDFEQGGEIAENLHRLYAYMRDTLNEANLHCDKEKINEVIELFKPLLEAWRDVAKDPEAAAALQQNVAAAPVQANAQPTYDQPEPEPVVATGTDGDDSVRISAAGQQKQPATHQTTAGHSAYGVG